MLSLPGMRERTVRNRLGRKELFADRLEGRLRDGRAGAARSDRQGAPVHDLHHAARSAEGGRLRAWPRTPAISTSWRRAFRQKRDRLAEACAALGLRRDPLPGHLFPDPRHARRSGWTGDDAALARRMTVEAGVTAVPVSAFYVSDAPKTFSPALLLEARRGARRGGGADAGLARVRMCQEQCSLKEERSMPIRALVWGENVHEQQECRGRQHLPRRHARDDRGGAARGSARSRPTTATLQEPEHGLAGGAARRDRRAPLVGPRARMATSPTRSSSACSAACGKGWG